MTLPSRQRIRNSGPGGLRPSTYFLVTEAPHNIESLRVSGKKTFCFFGTWFISPRTRASFPLYWSFSKNSWSRPTLRTASVSLSLWCRPALRLWIFFRVVSFFTNTMNMISKCFHSPSIGRDFGYPQAGCPVVAGQSFPKLLKHVRKHQYYQLIDNIYIFYDN